MRQNTKAAGPVIRTHEGAPAQRITFINALRRSVLSCLLWEKEFYEGGQAIAERIWDLAEKVSPVALAGLAVEARKEHHLRHVPLILLAALARRQDVQDRHLIALTAETVIDRADEITEFMAIYWRNGRCPISAQLKKGLRAAFANFDAYQLAKYDRDAKIKLADVMRMVRPKPADEAQAALFKGVRERTLTPPDTWEVALSAGADKKATFERLIVERKIGYLALLRNLRGMDKAGVSPTLVAAAITERRGARRVLPFRFVAAARACPQFEPALDKALCATIAELPMLEGNTAVLVDVSGSMGVPLSQKSDLSRMDAAATLACIVNAQNLRVFTFSHGTVEVPPRRGMAGVDAIRRSQPHGGTYLGAAITKLNAMPFDRLIVITDEQSHDAVAQPAAKHAYMINVASARNGVGYGRWTHLDGFSENVIRWIYESERAIDA